MGDKSRKGFLLGSNHLNKRMELPQYLQQSISARTQHSHGSYQKLPEQFR